MELLSSGQDQQGVERERPQRRLGQGPVRAMGRVECAAVHTDAARSRGAHGGSAGHSQSRRTRNSVKQPMLGRTGLGPLVVRPAHQRRHGQQDGPCARPTATRSACPGPRPG